MPILHYERHEASREFSVTGASSSITVHWFVTGTMDENDVYLTVLTATPPIFDSLVRDGISAKHHGGGNWYADIAYRSIAPQHGLPIGGPPGTGTSGSPGGPGSSAEFLGPNISWNTTGGTDHYKMAFRDVERKSAPGLGGTNMTRAQAAAAGYVGDNNRAIGSGPTGVAGTNVIVPTDRWSVEWNRDRVSMEYRWTMENLTGSVNDQPFYQYEIGELLFLGASGSNTNGIWKVVYNFEGKRNQTGVNIGDGITLEFVRGHEHIDVEYTRSPTTGLQVPKTARVMEVFPFADFELLEIGA